MNSAEPNATDDSDELSEPVVSRPTTHRPTTGNLLVDEILAELDDLQLLAPDEQLVRLSAAQEMLSQILADSRDAAQRPIPGLTAAGSQDTPQAVAEPGSKGPHEPSKPNDGRPRPTKPGPSISRR